MADCRDWMAVCDRMPPGPARLHVYGRCSRSGARLALKRHEPQSINPQELILERIQEGDKGISNEASDQLAEFWERFRGMECGYHTALILPDRIQLAVQSAFKTKNSVFRCDERIAGQVIRRYAASDRLAGLVGPALLGIFCCVGKPVRESDGLAPIGQAYLFAISAGWQSTTLAEGLDNSSIADQCGGWSAKPRRKRD